MKKYKLIKGNWYKLTEDYNKLKAGQVFPFIEYQDFGNKWAILNHGIYIATPGDYLAPLADNLIPATKEEVDKALKEEAIKRGYNKYTLVHCLSDQLMNSSKCGATNIQYQLVKINGFFFCGSNVIFYKEKWAKIINKEYSDIDIQKKILKDIEDENKSRQHT